MKRNRSPTNKPVMKRYATLDSSIGSRSVLDRSSFGSRSFSYHSPIVLLLFSYRSPIVLLLGNGKQYGNNTEWSERRTKDERMRLGGTRGGVILLLFISKFLQQWQDSMDFFPNSMAL